MPDLSRRSVEVLQVDVLLSRCHPNHRVKCDLLRTVLVHRSRPHRLEGAVLILTATIPWHLKEANLLLPLQLGNSLWNLMILIVHHSSCRLLKLNLSCV